jgi:hypothetical protein
MAPELILLNEPWIGAAQCSMKSADRAKEGGRDFCSPSKNTIVARFANYGYILNSRVVMDEPPGSWRQRRRQEFYLPSAAGARVATCTIATRAGLHDAAGRLDNQVWMITVAARHTDDQEYQNSTTSNARSGCP